MKEVHFSFARNLAVASALARAMERDSSGEDWSVDCLRRKRKFLARQGDTCETGAVPLCFGSESSSVLKLTHRGFGADAAAASALRVLKSNDPVAEPAFDGVGGCRNVVCGSELLVSRTMETELRSEQGENSRTDGTELDAEGWWSKEALRLDAEDPETWEPIEGGEVGGECSRDPLGTGLLDPVSCMEDKPGFPFAACRPRPSSAIEQVDFLRGRRHGKSAGGSSGFGPGR